MLTRREALKASALGAGALLFAPPAAAAQTVRIAVGRFREAITIEGDGLEALGGDGKRLATGRVTLAADAGGLKLGGRRVHHQVVQVASEASLKLHDHQYHRHLEVSWRSYKGRPELLVVHTLPLETYVLGVVSSELPQRWPYVGLKAQALAARTYAVWQKYRRLDLPYHMQSTVLDQVYHGAQREHAAAEKAIEETWGLVMTWGRRPAEAYFHSACGGHTESAEEGWSRPLPYLPGSKCGFCEKATRYQWRAEVSQAEMDAAMGKLLGESVTAVRVVARTRTGRVKTLELRGARRKKRITGGDLRRLVGYNRVWSTWLSRAERSGGAFVFEGRGAGHGVGMCQWGARGMAEAGHSAEAIVQRYYPGVELRRMY